MCHIYIYGTHHWRILWSSYRKLAWVGFEPTTTEFRSDALTDWAIRPWVQLALRKAHFPKRFDQWINEWVLYIFARCIPLYIYSVVFLGNTSLLFHQNCLDTWSATCMSSIPFFSSAVIVLLPFGESPLMTLTSILKNFELLYAGKNDSKVISLQHGIKAIICLHNINFFSQP